MSFIERLPAGGRFHCTNNGCRLTLTDLNWLVLYGPPRGIQGSPECSLAEVLGSFLHSSLLSPIKFVSGGVVEGATFYPKGGRLYLIASGPQPYSHKLSYMYTGDINCNYVYMNMTQGEARMLEMPAC